MRTLPRVVLQLTCFAMAGCHGADVTEGTIEVQRGAAFMNGGFETGTPALAPPSPWVVTPYLTPYTSGITIQTPQTLAGLNLLAQGGACVSSNDCANGANGTCQGGTCIPSAKTFIMNAAAGPMSQPDVTLGPTASLRWPRYGNQCALVNQTATLGNVNVLSQTMTIAAADVDAADGKPHVRFVIAPVLEDPGHTENQQPYVFVQLTNITQGGAVIYSDFLAPHQAAIPWRTLTAATRTYRYTDWQVVDVSSGMNQGDMVQLQIIAAGCAVGSHMGEAYVDGIGSTLPGLSIGGTGPAQANAGSNITYVLSFRNGGAAPANGTVIELTTPTNTTFQSLAPPPGATCTSLAVGTTGTITCSFSSSIAAGTGGSFNLTVSILPTTTGKIVLGNYAIHSATEATLLGPRVTTIVGCNADRDCTTGQWCFVSTHACTAKLANGDPLPNDPAHVSPTLDQTCSAQVAATVCASGACDANGRICGLKVGDGTCTSSTQCIASLCVTAGPNAGRCEPCSADIDCPASKPLCAPNSNSCVQCLSDTDCGGSTPVCQATGACGPAAPADAGSDAIEDAGANSADGAAEAPATPADATADVPAASGDATTDAPRAPDAPDDGAAGPGQTKSGSGGCSCEATGGRAGYLAPLFGLAMLLARRRRR